MARQACVDAAPGGLQQAEHLLVHAVEIGPQRIAVRVQYHRHRRVGLDQSRLDHIASECLVFRVRDVAKGHTLHRRAPHGRVDVGEVRQRVTLTFGCQSWVVDLQHQEVVRPERTEVVDHVALDGRTAVRAGRLFPVCAGHPVRYVKRPQDLAEPVLVGGNSVLGQEGDKGSPGHLHREVSGAAVAKA